MAIEPATPPADWTAINPEVASIASTRAMTRYEVVSLSSIFIAVTLATALRQFPFYLGAFIDILCLFALPGFIAQVVISNKRVAEVHKYLSWIFATRSAEERSVSLEPYPIQIAYRPVGTLLIAKVYGLPDEQLQHEVVVTVPDAHLITDDSLNVVQPCKIQYDPESHEPVVIDLGTYRCWRAPGFACPPDLPKNTPRLTKMPREHVRRKINPHRAIIIWSILFAFGFKYFLSPGQFAMIDGRGGAVQKWGFIDKKGNIVIRPMFDRVNGIGKPTESFGMAISTMRPQQNFHEGLAGVCVDNRWGFVDKTGKMLIKPQFDEVGDFSEGLASVALNDKCGFIDRTGKIVIPIQYGQHLFMLGRMNFKDGLCEVESNSSQVGFIDKQGHEVIKSEFSSAMPFENGLAEVSSGYSGPSKFIDRTGKTVLEISDKHLDLATVRPSGNFSEGLVPVSGYTSELVPQARYWFEDRTGKPLGSALFQNAKSFSDGLAAAMPIGSNKFGFIDHKGQMVIQPAFDDVGEFHEDVAPVSIENRTGKSIDREWGYINKNGDWLVKPKYKTAGVFYEGRAVVMISKDIFSKFGYIDTSGQEVIPPQFSNGFPFSEGLAAVQTGQPLGPNK